MKINQIKDRLKLLVKNWYFYDLSVNLLELIDHYQELINQIKKEVKIPIIFVAEANPDRFVAAFFAGVLTDSCIFLINPHWQTTEWQQVAQLVTPDLIFGEIDYCFTSSSSTSPRFTGIMIPTGGTSGQIKFAIHTWQTLTASAQGFYRYFAEQPLNFYSCLPLYHVSGLMPIIRSLISQGKLIVNLFTNLKNNCDLKYNYQDFFISFVPTQLQYFGDRNPQFLTHFKTILVGGAAINPLQIALAKKYQIPLALTYGMTETASGITILKTEDFLQNNHSNGQVLPHAQILIEGQNTGQIAIAASSLFKGYYPNYKQIEYFQTDDLGYLDENKYLYILGRNSHKIISGGENVYPLEVEKAIFNTGLVKDVYVRGEHDHYWGQIVTAFYVPQHQKISITQIKALLTSKISKYKIPKKWYQMASIPRNQQGKINQAKLCTTRQ